MKDEVKTFKLMKLSFHPSSLLFSGIDRERLISTKTVLGIAGFDF